MNGFILMMYWVQWPNNIGRGSKTGRIPSAAHNALINYAVYSMTLFRLILQRGNLKL